MLVDKAVVGVVAAMAATILINGCASNGIALVPGTTKGTIFVGSPKISTRERLVNDRFEQDAWLRRELENADNKQFGFEGAMDRRSFQGITARLGIQADPTKVRIYRAEQDNQLQRLIRQREIEALRHEQDKQRLVQAAPSPTPSDNERIKALDDEIKKLQAQIKDLETKAVGGSKVPIPGQPTDATKSLFDQTDERLKGLKEKLDSLLVKPAPDKPADFVSASPVDELRDKLAYRDELRNAIIENALDERHDLHGNTLFRLSFDVTVLPDHDTSAWAVIEATLRRKATEPPSDAKEIELLRREFRTQTAKFLNDRLSSLLSYVDCMAANSGETRQTDTIIDQCMEAMPDHVAATFRRTSARTLSSIRIGFDRAAESTRLRSSAKQLSGSSSLVARRLIGNQLLELGETCVELPDYAIPVSPLTVALCKLLKNETPADRVTGEGQLAFLRLTGHLVAVLSLNEDFEDVLRDLGQEIGVPLTIQNPYLHLRPYGMTNHQRALTPKEDIAAIRSIVARSEATFEAAIGKRRDIYAYAVTPREFVQRISDVASRREMTDFMLALNLLAGNVGAEAFTSFVNANQGVYNAIRRQPLIVGFGNDIRQESGAATFGWIVGPRFSTSSDGKSAQFRHSPVQHSVSALLSVPEWWPSVEVTATARWIDEKGETIKTEEGLKPRLIRLPNNPTALLDEYSPVPRRPYPETRERYALNEGSPASIIIKGENLWRSALVTVGGQKADRVEVTPDMKGLIAHFDRIRPVSGAGSVPVTVWTSEGNATVGQAIITSKTVVSKAKVEFGKTALIADQPAEIVVREGQGLAGNTKIEIRLLPLGTWLEPRDTKQTARGFTFLVPNAADFSAVKLKAASGDRLIARATATDGSPIETSQPAIYYSEPQHSQLQVAITERKNPQFKLKLTLPANAFIAYPDVAVPGSPAAVRLEVKDTSSNPAALSVGSNACQVKNDTCEIAVSLGKSPLKPEELTAIRLRVVVLGSRDALVVDNIQVQ